MMKKDTFHTSKFQNSPNLAHPTVGWSRFFMERKFEITVFVELVSS
jgi:hypothetical protein